MNKNKLIIKGIVLLVAIIIMFVITSLSPVIGAQATINQLNNEYTSHTLLNFWRIFAFVKVPALTIFAVILFKNEIKDSLSN